MELDPDQPFYRAGEHTYSLNEILLTGADPQYLSNGMPRISDFHFKAGEPVRFRMDGELTPLKGGDLLSAAAVEAIVRVLIGPSYREAFAADTLADVDTSYNIQGCTFRINAFREIDGPAAAVRLLPPEVPSPSKLGFPSDGVWEGIVQRRQGLVLLTGQTGSGKSTTIASLVQHMTKTRALRVITLEDPIEYRFQPGRGMVSQREIGKHTRSFGDGLRSAVREDPDIIYVGEMRDSTSAGLALTAAETGHLVFTTLHTRDTIGAITRIVDLFPEREQATVCAQLAMSLAYVVCQKLVDRADGKGRIPAMEVLRNSPAISNMLRSGKWQQIYSNMQTGGADSMVTMEASLDHLYQRGIISANEVRRNRNRPDEADAPTPRRC